MTIKARGKVWLWPGESAQWHFFTFTGADADKIRRTQEGKKRVGWGSVRVTAVIGNTVWSTSVFPERGSKSYVLPLNARVRKAEEIRAGETVSVSITLQESSRSSR